MRLLLYKLILYYLFSVKFRLINKCVIRHIEEKNYINYYIKKLYKKLYKVRVCICIYLYQCICKEIRSNNLNLEIKHTHMYNSLNK